MSYPKWVTRAHGIGPVLCLTAEEEAGLMADWSKRELPADDLEALRSVADARGLKYDKRWGAAKLREALED